MEGPRGRRILIEERTLAVACITEAVEAGSYLEPACRALSICVRTYNRWKTNTEGERKRGPKLAPANKLSEEERNEVVDICTSEKFRDKSPAQIVPFLADEGRYVASESSFYRILKDQGLNAHRTKSKPSVRHKPKALTATAPNQVYSWDITYLPLQIRGFFVYLYFFMDIYSRKIVGHAVHESQTGEHASELIKKICMQEGIEEGQLDLHSDNGGPMKGASMLSALQMLGIVPSFSRPAVSDDNPFSESLFKTLKYCPQYPSRPFESIEAAREWVNEFVNWYNNVHLHSGIKFVTPASRHEGSDIQILKSRKQVYENAKEQNPLRWSGETRNWEPTAEVFLNPLKDKSNAVIDIAA